MHQINIKTSMKLSESSGLAKLPESSKKSSRTSTNQILNDINDSNSKYFESS